MPKAVSNHRPRAASPCRLKSPNWAGPARVALEQLIRKGSGKGLPVVFDFDNTIIGGDIGEAVLAVLARRGRLTPAAVPAACSPAFVVSGKGRVTLETAADITEYYEALLAPTVHGRCDPTPLANGYVWAVEVLAGLRVSEVVAATREAFEWRSRRGSGFIEVTPGRTGYPAPFFHAEMVELLAELARRRFDIWIVSASNVWSVRWMVRFGLNPLLAERGVTGGVRADHVVGVSTLLTDRRGQLYKDAVLVRERRAYAALDPKLLRSLRLTGWLQFPVPIYSGKVSVLLDALGRAPYLCAGDSPSDHPMLALSRHRLWICRLDKPAYQQATLKLMHATGEKGWIVQPTSAPDGLGFVSDPAQLCGGKLKGEPHNGKPARVSAQPRDAAQNHLLPGL